MLLLCFMLSSGVMGQTVMDSLDVSVITCSPGQEVYSLYGHTALRIRNYTRAHDWVFNYGVFDFNTPNFVWRFTLGQCDYTVEAVPFEYFCREYIQRGSEVIEQTLNINAKEKNQLLGLMALNMRPENRNYRYNFLTNNCTTRVRDQIEKAIDGNVVYLEREQRMTYREILHEFTNEYPWAEQGNDILLGVNCDTVLSDRAAQFIPSYLMHYLDDAVIYDDMGNSRSLVADKHVLLQAGDKGTVEKEFPLSPLEVGFAFLAFCLLLMGVEYWSHRMMWLIDIPIMLVHGLAGLLLWFVFFFSEHPTLDSNWQIWAFHPLGLLALPWVVKSAYKGKMCLYHYINIAILTLFVLFSAWIPQDFGDIVLPLALGLLVRSVSYHFSYTRNRKA